MLFRREKARLSDDQERYFHHNISALLTCNSRCTSTATTQQSLD